MRMSVVRYVLRRSRNIKCQYADCNIQVFDSESRELKIACAYDGLLVHTSEIKNNLGIDTGIVPHISGFPMQKHDDQHKMWAQAYSPQPNRPIPTRQ